MNTAMICGDWAAIAEHVNAYKAVREKNDVVDLRQFLPEDPAELRTKVLHELVRLEVLRHPDTAETRLKAMLAEYPEMADDTPSLELLQWEAQQARENGPAPNQGGNRVERRIISTQQLDVPKVPAQQTPVALLRSVTRVNEHPEPDPRNVGQESVERLLAEKKHLPPPGGKFHDFQLLGELGRGAFGKVYLATQGKELAERLVVLKISAESLTESNALAQLQHTNIVPIYSSHAHGKLKAICMPYFGSVTMQNLLDTLQKNNIPRSGMVLISTLQDCRKKTTLGSDSPGQDGNGPDTSTSEKMFLPVANHLPNTTDATATEILERLQNSNYVDAVLWWIARLADGLAHAHARGIIHRDLKPANILITDEGQPMLLDFNLAVNQRLSPETALRLGGTIPYMSPEQMEAFQGSNRAVDARSDIYSLGVIAFEMLALKHPFPGALGPAHSQLPRMLIERKSNTPTLRLWNNMVSREVEAIIQRCLEPSPNRRYQTAAALKEDIENHLNGLPLKHVREPFLTRVMKWKRRHPKLTSSTTVGLVALLLLLTVGTVAGMVVYDRSEKLAHYDAESKMQEFLRDRKEAEVILCIHTDDWNLREKGKQQIRELLERYDVLGEADWQKRSDVQRLSIPNRARLRESVGDLLTLLARAEVTDLVRAGPREDPRETLQEALRLNRQAQKCFDEAHRPKALLTQEREWSFFLDSGSFDHKFVEEDFDPDSATARDNYLRAADLAGRRKYNKALPHALSAVEKDPDTFSAWYRLGDCRFHLAQFEKADSAFSSCLAIENHYLVRFNRGLARLYAGRKKEAYEDFTQVIQEREDMADAYYFRALCVESPARLSDPQEKKKGDTERKAIDDLSKALELGAHPMRTLLLRANAYERLGEKALAEKDRSSLLVRPAADESSWIVRGLVHLPGEPKEALSDFDQALKINPNSRKGMQGKVHVLADLMSRYADAIEVLDRLLELFPDYVDARSWRAIYLARENKRAEALADAELCLKQDISAKTIYQIATVFALTSRENPPDEKRALKLLAQSMSQGFGLDKIDKESAFDPLRDHEQFKEIVAAARTLAKHRSGR